MLFMSEIFQKMVYKKGNLGNELFHTTIGYFSRIKTLTQLRQYDIV